jgi:8-oxo-dGTP pyrophosphatase MutT (NUDIX family)
MEKGESELDAVQREVFEETGLQIPKEKFVFLKTVFGRYPGEYDFYYHMFKVELKEKPEIKISPNEHQAYEWFTIKKALSYPLLKDQDGAILSVEDVLFK